MTRSALLAPCNVSSVICRQLGSTNIITAEQVFPEGNVYCTVDIIMWVGGVVVTLSLLGIISTEVSPLVSPWWKDAVFYRLLVDSFKDSDGDGLGDIAGATKQLSYIRALGADAVLLSPLFARSSDCTKPGVVDPMTLDIRYGTLSQLNDFLDKAKKLDIKVALELALQTISTSSEWFSSSVNKSAAFDDFIVCKDAPGDNPPEPTIGVESWVWNEDRNSYWAARDNQAVLNLCSKGLVATLAATQCAWLRRGLSGFLITPDYPIDEDCPQQLVQQLSSAALQCAKSSNLDVPMTFVESFMGSETAAKYYGASGVGASSVLSVALTSVTRKTTAETAISVYSDIIYSEPGLLPVWTTSTLINGRIATRYGIEMVDVINLLVLILPGAAIIQQGDELGSADTLMEWVDNTPGNCWPNPPKPAFAPFPWDDTMNAGFSPAEPWMPLSPNYRYANAKTEFKSESGHIGVVRVAAAMRKSPAIGPHVEIKRLGETLAVLRWGGAGSLLLVCNLGKDSSEAQLSDIPGLPHEMAVASTSVRSSAAVGSHIIIEKTLRLVPGEAILMAGAPRHCGGPGPVDKITNKLAEGWQKINKYFGNN